MITVIGEYGSPFVKRVCITLNFYNTPYELNPLTTLSDTDAMAKTNPLRRIPNLILEDGDVLIDSSAIIDYLDERAGPEKALTPTSGKARRDVLKTVALGMGICDKAVSAYYEKARRPEGKTWEGWIDKCTQQVTDALIAIEHLPASNSDWLHGDQMSQADITTLIAYNFVHAVLPDVIKSGSFSKLAALKIKIERFNAFTREPGDNN